jgi:hypothetical protein
MPAITAGISRLNAHPIRQNRQGGMLTLVKR